MNNVTSILKRLVLCLLLAVTTNLYVKAGFSTTRSCGETMTCVLEVETGTQTSLGSDNINSMPGEPILLKHAELIEQYANEPIVEGSDFNRADVFGELAEVYDAAPLTPVLSDFRSNVDYADGQTFLLEGGKTYYLDGQDVTCKGMVLRTDPADVAEGKRARVICGLGKNSQYYTSSTNGEQWQGSYTMFMFGRQPEAGEDGEIYMKKLAFHDLDFDNPMAFNEGDYVAGLGTVAGNYFFNMYSNGMAVTLDSLVIENCSFKRLVRGFIREQGVNYKIWNHVLIKNNLFMDCGYYNNGKGGYSWIAGSGNCTKSNLYADFKCIENTFYDSPFPSFFSEVWSTLWESGIVWNITFSNNTLVNFNTRGNGAIFKMRYLPDGSVFNVENNLIMLCKQPDDVRVLKSYGADIRETMTLEDGTLGKVTLNFNNNWSTNNDLTNGQIFSGNPWTATSNNFGTLVKNNLATLNGTLEVNVASVSATELMVQPCPPHVAKTSDEQNMHRADALDGTATTEYNVNLYFNNTDEVRNSEIYKQKVGAGRWHESVTEAGSIETVSGFAEGEIVVYDLKGCMIKKVQTGNGCLDDCIQNLPSGIYLLKQGDKVMKVSK